MDILPTISIQKPYLTDIKKTPTGANLWELFSFSADHQDQTTHANEAQYGRKGRIIQQTHRKLPNPSHTETPFYLLIIIYTLAGSRRLPN